MHPFIAEALLAIFIGVEAIQLLTKDNKQCFGNAIRVFDFGFIILGALFVVTLIAHLTVDVRYLCVMHHNHSAQALHYRLASLWSHHETSLFVWLCLLNCLSSWTVIDDLARFRRRILAFINVCLALYMCVEANPFASTPFVLLHQESHGLNPLLYDLNMVWHPPLLYLGQVWLFIPYALGLYATRHNGMALDLILYHTKIGFGVLTIAIALGSFWAFTQLGWGGFWFWDPVETASLLPWLAALIVFHIPQYALFKRPWLTAMPFVCVCVSMWIIRSGILLSVHSFAKNAMAFWLLGAFVCFMTLFVILSAYQPKQQIVYVPLPQLHPKSKDARAWLLTLGLCLLGGTLLVVCMGLFIPLIFKITLASSFFNTTLLPMWAAIALLMALVPKSLKRLSVAHTTALLSGLLYLIMYWDLSLPYMLLGVCGALCVGVMIPFMRKRTCLSFAHMGIGFCLIGFASYSINPSESTLVLNRGVPLAHGLYTLTFSNATKENGDFTSILSAHIHIMEMRTNKCLTLKPAKQYFHTSQLQRPKADFGMIDRGKIVLITSIEPLTENTMAITFHEKSGLIWLCLGVFLVGFAMLWGVINKPCAYRQLKVTKQ